VAQVDRPRLDERLALRPAEAARALGISERALRELAPELPRIRRGRLTLFPVDGLREWLKREAEAQGRADERVAREILDSLTSED
jgi:Helix-turn-helix domain